MTPEEAKWFWMMDWCKTKSVPPADYYWWNKAEEAYKISSVRYASGVGINLDVLDAQLQLNQARTNYITALYDYNIGLATLENAMGIPAVIHTETTVK